MSTTGGSHSVPATPCRCIHPAASTSSFLASTNARLCPYSAKVFVLAWSWPVIPHAYVNALFSLTCAGLGLCNLLTHHQNHCHQSRSFKLAYCHPSDWHSQLQAKELLPVTLPTDQKALAFIADAVAEHNRQLANSKAKASSNSNCPLGDSQTFCGDASPVSEDAGVHITPWLATSLAPIAAAVTIQAHWLGWVTRRTVGLLGPQLLCRRGAVCIQRAWRSCKLLLSTWTLFLLGTTNHTGQTMFQWMHALRTNASSCRFSMLFQTELEG